MQLVTFIAIIAFFVLLGASIYMMLQFYVCDNYDCKCFKVADKKTEKENTLKYISYLQKELGADGIWPIAYISSAILTPLFLWFMDGVIYYYNEQNKVGEIRIFSVKNFALLFLISFAVMYFMISFVVHHYIKPVVNYTTEEINKINIKNTEEYKNNKSSVDTFIVNKFITPKQNNTNSHINDESVHFN